VVHRRHRELLGRPPRPRCSACRLSLLKDEGAVSKAVVEAMAKGALERTGADRAVAVSGIAGPAGGTVEKPVGTVWFAWARRDEDEITFKTRLEHFQGDREGIRRQTVGRALSGVMMS
jgi:nicotinamide-nucleotide amidase